MEAEHNYTGKEKQIYEAIVKNQKKEDGHTTEVKIYNNGKTNNYCEAYIPEDEPLDPHEVIELIQDYIAEEADSYEKFIVSVKKNARASGTKITIMGNKRGNKLGHYNNKNTRTGGVGDLSLVSLLVGRMDNESVLNAKIAELNAREANRELIKEIKNELSGDINYYKKEAKRTKKKLKKKKKKEKEANKKGAVAKFVESETGKKIGDFALAKIFDLMEGEDEEDDFNVVPLKKAQYRELANVAGTAPTPTNTTATRTLNTPPIPTTATEEEEEVEDLTDDELDALDGVKYLEKHGYDNPGLMVYAASRVLVKKKNSFGFKQVMKEIKKEMVIIRNEQEA